MKNEVRPIDAEPLTLEQLRGMVGHPVIVKYSYGGPDTVAIVNVHFVPHLGSDKIRLVFADGYITVNEKDYGTYFTVYAYPLAHIDRETWTAEWIYPENKWNLPICSKCGCNSQDATYGHKDNFCPRCGRAMTPEAWAELEKRMGVRA